MQLASRPKKDKTWILHHHCPRIQKNNSSIALYSPPLCISYRLFFSRSHSLAQTIDDRLASFVGVVVAAATARVVWWNPLVNDPESPHTHSQLHVLFIPLYFQTHLNSLYRTRVWVQYDRIQSISFLRSWICTFFFLPDADFFFYPSGLVHLCWSIRANCVLYVGGWQSVGVFVCGCIFYKVLRLFAWLPFSSDFSFSKLAFYSQLENPWLNPLH